MANKLYHLKGTPSIGPKLDISFVTDDGTSHANAKAVAQSVSTLFLCNVSVYLDGDATLVAAKTPGTQGTTVSCPSVVQLTSVG